MTITKTVGHRKVDFVLTTHAYNQFAKRLRLLYGNIPDHRILSTLKKYFMESKRLKRMSRAKKNRDNKYEGKTIYFRTKLFNFIVAGENNSIVTIELNGDKKHLNKHTTMERRLSRV